MHNVQQTTVATSMKDTHRRVLRPPIASHEKKRSLERGNRKEEKSKSKSRIKRGNNLTIEKKVDKQDNYKEKTLDMFTR